MELSINISNIILSMREFQKKNCIKEQCVTNVQYLYDCIKTNCSINNIKVNVKTQAVFVTSNDQESGLFTFVAGHLIVVLDNETFIDPSYDIFCLKNKRYFDNIKDLMNNFDNESKDIIKTKLEINKKIDQHITFIKLAEQINNGELIITDKDFYNNQADYIEKLIIQKKI